MREHWYISSACLCSLTTDFAFFLFLHKQFARANNPPPKTPAKAPAKAPANPPTKAPPATKGGKSTPVLFTGSDVETQARAANNAPGRNV